LSVFESTALRRQILSFLAGGPVEHPTGAADACCALPGSASPVSPAGRREAGIR